MKILTIFSSLIISLAISVGLYDIYRSDMVTRHVVRIFSENGMCSGEQITAPSGKNYILTAGHCRHLALNSMFTIEMYDGTIIKKKLIKEDPLSDLLLIEGISGLGGLTIAKTANFGDSVRAYTHGKNFNTFKTIGELIQYFEVQIVTGTAMTKKEKEECSKYSKHKIEHTAFGNICIMKVLETVTTAGIYPGSSGGAVVNFRGQLVGVASASDGDFGYLVRLIDITQFLEKI